MPYTHPMISGGTNPPRPPAAPTTPGRYPDEMCRLHAGIVDGVLETSGQPGNGVVVIPFAAPGACVVRLVR